MVDGIGIFAPLTVVEYVVYKATKNPIGGEDAYRWTNEMQEIVLFKAI